jgi:uncharacterized protein YjiS (DUF1127 family)
MSTTTIIPLIRPGPIHHPGSRAYFALLNDTLCLWVERRRGREALANLAEDAHLLADIGLTRDQVRNETGKPFWR